MSKNVAEYRVVCVEWEDAWGFKDDQNHSRDEIVEAPPYIRNDIGFLLSHDKRGICLASSQSFQIDESFSNSTFIPTPMIRKVTHYAKGRK